LILSHNKQNREIKKEEIQIKSKIREEKIAYKGRDNKKHKNRKYRSRFQLMWRFDTVFNFSY
jgi:hypothetical protein